MLAQKQFAKSFKLIVFKRQMWITEPFFESKLYAAIFQNGRLKSLWARYLINRRMDRIQILYASSVGISDAVINFWEEFIKNKIANGGNFEKMALKKLVGAISYEPLVGSHIILRCWFSWYF